MGHKYIVKNIEYNKIKKINKKKKSNSTQKHIYYNIIYKLKN